MSNIENNWNKISSVGLYLELSLNFMPLGLNAYLVQAGRSMGEACQGKGKKMENRSSM